jgi:hypothetical protein
MISASPPARCEVRVYARLEPIKLGGQEIHFKFAVPGRLYRADGPAMRVVQTGRLFQAKKPLGPTPRNDAAKWATPWSATIVQMQT